MLEGVDPGWKEEGGEMFLNVRFADARGEQIDRITFSITGESQNWTGDMQNPVLVPRRETLVVPPHASVVWIEFTSAGPPSTVGQLLVSNILVSRTGENGSVETLISGPRGRTVDPRFPKSPSPLGFIVDGTRPNMARLLTIRQSSTTAPIDCMAIIDEDPLAHAEWHTVKQEGPLVVPGEKLTIFWQGAFSVGYGAFF